MPLKTVCKKSDYKVEEIRNQLHINCQKPNLKIKADQKLCTGCKGRNFSMEMPNPSRRSKKKSLTSCKDQKVLLFYNEKKKKQSMDQKCKEKRLISLHSRRN